MRVILFFLLVVSSVTVLAADCSLWEAGPISEAMVKHWMSEPGYTSFDERVVHRSGDAVATAILKYIPDSQLETYVGARQAILLLDLSFSTPDQIEACANRNPKSAHLLLDKLQNMKSGKDTGNYLNNTRSRISIWEKSGQGLTSVRDGVGDDYDAERIQWLAAILISIGEIKPGMTRKQLKDVFREEGGISSRQRQTYVHRLCPYAKVRVEFSPGSRPESREEMPDDIITSISAPYLQFSIVD